MLALLLTTLAHAVPPDAEPDRIAFGNGRLERLAVSDDGAFVVGREATTQDGFVLSVEDWTIRRLNFCDVAGIAVVPVSVGDAEFWVGCTDGSLRPRRFEGGALVPVTDADGKALQVDLGTSLRGVWFHDGAVPAVYALSVSGEIPRVHAVDVDTLDADGRFLAGYPLDLQTWTGYREAVLSADRLIVHHSADHVTAVVLGPNPSAAPNTVPTLAIEPADLAPSPALGAYAVDPDGYLAEYQPATLFWQLLLDGLDAPRGVGASLDPEDRWVLVAGSRIRTYAVSNLGTIDPEPVWTSALDASRDVRDVVVADGYAFGGGSGRLHVFTARPWIDPDRVKVSPTQLTTGDVARLTFASSRAGRYEVRLGGSRKGGGRLLASGDLPADRVGEDVTVEIPVEGSHWNEGDNALYVFVTDARGLTGHARAAVFVDTPPDPPELTDANLSFADGALLLSFAGIPDADLDRYEIYVTTTPFSREDWPTGGPPWDGSTKLTTPIVVRKAPGEAVTRRIEPLENDVKHYIAVRAFDRGGLEGPMSRVVSEVPRPSFRASDLAGEDGGAPCSTAPGSAGLAAAVAAFVARRRRRLLRVAATVAVLGLLAPTTARAGDEDDVMTPEEARRIQREERKKQRWRDETPVRGNVELRYGIIDIDDEHIDRVYDKGPHDLLLAEVGPQIWKVLELDFGLGFLQEIDRKIDAEGVKSGEVTMLTWFPLSLDATFRLQVFDEQPLVPHARFGFDYVLWSEKADDGRGGKITTRGAKTGNHVALGAGLLLDVFARRRASLLEAQTGINDTYLVVEWRRQFVDGRERPWSAPVHDGFDFSGDSVTAGLKLDF